MGTGWLYRSWTYLFSEHLRLPESPGQFRVHHYLADGFYRPERGKSVTAMK